MSIRLHELAKKIGMDNKDLLALLKQRDYPVKTVSSTIDKITAESLEQELGKKPAEVPRSRRAGGGRKGGGGQRPAGAGGGSRPSFTTRVPAGVFVRSAQDIAREKEELARASRPQVVFPAPRPRGPCRRCASRRRAQAVPPWSRIRPPARAVAPPPPPARLRRRPPCCLRSPPPVRPCRLRSRRPPAAAVSPLPPARRSARRPPPPISRP